MRGQAPLREDLVAFLVRPHEPMPNLAISLVQAPGTCLRAHFGRR